jgi:DNA-binding transcriptional ArsR family regulator
MYATLLCVANNLDDGMCLLMKILDDVALEHVADYFRALGVPLRLKLLNALRERECSVGELTEMLGCSQANVSKHLAVLNRSGLVRKTARGTSTFYRIADPRTYELCDLVCGQIGRRYAEETNLRRLFAEVSGERNKKRERQRSA